MNLDLYLLYCLTVIIMIATPGPVMMLVASAGLKGGFKHALHTILGTNLASLVLIALSVGILKGLFTVDEQWMSLIRLLGCLYILWIGIQILKEVMQQPDLDIKPSQKEGGFIQGFLVGISNPKDILFFISFFPQFIQVMPQLNQGLMLLIGSWIVLDFMTLSAVYLMFNRLAGSQVYKHLLLLCGLILMFVAAYGIYTVVCTYL